MNQFQTPIRAVIFAMLLTPAAAFGWGATNPGSGQFNPSGSYQYGGAAASGPGAYKYGYGNYNDRTGFYPGNPGTPLPPNPGAAPTHFPVTTTFYGGYRSGSSPVMNSPGVFIFR